MANKFEGEKQLYCRNSWNYFFTFEYMNINFLIFLFSSNPPPPQLLKYLFGNWFQYIKYLFHSFQPILALTPLSSSPRPKALWL